MKLQAVIKLALFLLLVGCTDTFYETEILGKQADTLIANDWQKKNFWIGQQSIVFDMEIQFKEDYSFQMFFEGLGKKNTSYEKFIRSGKWALSADGQELSLKYEQSSGIIGYYLETSISDEMYQIKFNNKEISLLNETDGEVFDLDLVHL